MSEGFDAIVIGMGPGGEVVASRLLDAGRRVAVIERELIGGECGYWACIPSKTLLRPTEARGEADRAAGLQQPALDWVGVRGHRDTMIRHLDDSQQVESYRARGARVVQGPARLAGPGQVEVNGQQLRAEHVILATGSETASPPIEGLGDVTVWTNREATTLHEIPERAVLIGGSAVGIELGHFLARMGTAVTIVQRGPRLLGREEPRVGELVAAHLADEGIDIRTDTQARRTYRDGTDTVVELDDGAAVRTDVIVLAAGRRARLDGLGLDSVGITGDHSGVDVDERCRVTDGLWAVGDLTGVSLFTHLAQYQGRVVADNILGHDRITNYTAIPRVVFTDPEIAAVGLTTAQARERGIDVATTELDLTQVLARPWTYETDPRGTLGLLADRRRQVLIGAWAVAPLAEEWIHQAALAIRARIPLETLLDTIPQFPTYSEAYLKALETLQV
ncbi:dihydrolipoamide dehydrogenase [Halopolyspora algeriensis]|uniref:Dihydrolipoamide dehydrogenase n=1 Tax=Halopolyspora algeriensis TaxID=1500506 RepID=A0A368VHP4_9ACTN|nr:NAD(P)/FAD-dependent oxidoreductase [Halopolyspora algeriensis]RCW40936.1 dihydrolipoamide dehydrogenase [Halopolyspora algeriensis]TQM53978.1 dihydrolipoamide dehydrogenase [Halopolyspora algeriensis]